MVSNKNQMVSNNLPTRKPQQRFFHIQHLQTYPKYTVLDSWCQREPANEHNYSLWEGDKNLSYPLSMFIIQIQVRKHKSLWHPTIIWMFTMENETACNMICFEKSIIDFKFRMVAVWMSDHDLVLHLKTKYWSFFN